MYEYALGARLCMSLFASVHTFFVCIVVCRLWRKRGQVVRIGMSCGKLQHRVDGQPRQINVRGECLFVRQRRGIIGREMPGRQGQEVRKLQERVQAERGQYGV